MGGGGLEQGRLFLLLKISGGRKHKNLKNPQNFKEIWQEIGLRLVHGIGVLGGPPQSPPLAVQPRKFLKVNSWGGSARSAEPLFSNLYYLFSHFSSKMTNLHYLFCDFLTFFRERFSQDGKIRQKWPKIAVQQPKFCKVGGKNFGGKNKTTHLWYR